MVVYLVRAPDHKPHYHWNAVRESRVLNPWSVLCHLRVYVVFSLVGSLSGSNDVNMM